MDDNVTKLTESAMRIIAKAMDDDDPKKPGSYAHAWHCNIAMCCYDAIVETVPLVETKEARGIANKAASNFMKLCFGVKTE